MINSAFIKLKISLKMIKLIILIISQSIFSLIRIRPGRDLNPGRRLDRPVY